jgi:undecaprenyl-diphosphatase
MTTLIIFCAKYLIFVIAIGGFVYMAQSPRRKHIALFSAVTLPIAYIVAKMVGWFWYDPRPFVESGVAPLVAHAADNGFPSDHTLLAMTIAAIVFVYDKRLGVFCLYRRRHHHPLSDGFFYRALGIF